MKRAFLFGVLFFIGCSSDDDCCSDTDTDATPPPQAEELTAADREGLVWNDEFDQSTLDTSKWNFQTGDGTAEGIPGWGNGEEQTYTNRTQNLQLENGFLKITARKESLQGKSYTSARINTQDKFSLQYGRIVVRATLPKLAGTWPAVWMLGDNYSNVGWPRCGEIDFIEQNGQEKDKIIGTSHWFDEGSSNNAKYSTTLDFPNLTESFQKYTLVWNEAYIRMFVGSAKYYEIALNDTLPFDQPFFLLINLAMGGTLGGNINSTFLQEDFLIDYIRIYEN
ncbi:MAG: glycoside hydrolase family 16 protein [Flavobacteriales bacterium]